MALEPCGVSSKTIWVADSYDTIKGFFVPLINGSDTKSCRNPFLFTSGAGLRPAPLSCSPAWSARERGKNAAIANPT